MVFDEVVFEYAARGITFTKDELKSMPDDWADSCVRCDVCNIALLHDDEAYFAAAEGVWVCDDHAAIDEATDEYIRVE